MRLTQLTLENFRCFERLEMTLHPECNVLFGINGSGKTALLEGAAVALGAWFLGFDEHQPRPILEDDVRQHIDVQHDTSSLISMYPTRVSARGLIDDEEVAWARALTRKGGKTTTAQASTLKKLAASRQADLKALREVDLPVFAYYPSNRLWIHSKDSQHKKDKLPSRTQGYVDCLNTSSSSKLFEDWMRWRKEIYLERIAKWADRKIHNQTNLGILDSYHPSNFDMQLRGVEYAIEQGLKKHDFEYLNYNFERKELEVVKIRNDKINYISGEPEARYVNYPFSIMSDGVRNAIAMFADLAWRAVMLNPHHGKDAPALARGVVLIDELDLHLHPGWQREILGDLRRAFPNIQFIITTHSPQVLGSALDEWVQEFTADQQLVASPRVKGQDTNRILTEVMNVSERDEETAQALDQLSDEVEAAEEAADAHDHDALRAHIAEIEAQLKTLSAQLGEDASELAVTRYTLHSLSQALL